MKVRDTEDDPSISRRLSDNIMSITEAEITEITEGSTILYVPRSSLNTTVPPMAPAFYNPYGELNRSLSTAAYRVFSERRTEAVTMIDVLAGTGARGIRVAVEVPKISEVYINDRNPLAIELAKKSSDANKVTERCRFSVRDACQILSEHSAYKSRFNIVDIDPFGSPHPTSIVASEQLREKVFFQPLRLTRRRSAASILTSPIEDTTATP